MRIKSLLFLGGLAGVLACSVGPEGPQGDEGFNSLVRTSVEPSGTNCATGGIRIDSGLDSDANGTLDEGEVSDTQYLCSVSAINSLVNVASLDAGSECTNGGIQVDSGLDSNGDGVLDESEIQVTRFVCNGTNGNGSGGGFYDELIRLSFGVTDYASSGITYSGIFGEPERLLAFNKNHYIGADSIVFAVNLRSSVGAVTSYAELYNVTNGLSIAGSEVQTNYVGEQPDYIFSGNIYNQLPDDNVDLAFRLRSENFGQTSVDVPAYLFIFRRNI